MATAARFGRLPRNAPSLTATIVALAQEYQRVRDSNIEDAWTNGGQFEGHKVTDEELLKYWRKRREDVSHDDPNWDVINNRIHGYEFNIAESKAYLAYKRGHLSEQGMANFYTHWANKMPSNSANWRDLMTKAATFKASAARGRAASNAQARANAYGNQQQNTYDHYVGAYDVLTGAVMKVMHDNNVIDQKDINSDSPDSQNGWATFTVSGGQNDPASLNAFLSWLNSDDPNAKSTRTDLTKQIQHYDKNFDGHFTPQSIGRLHDRAIHGDNVMHHRGKKFGLSKTDLAALDKNKDRHNMSGSVLGSSDYTKQALDKQGEIEAVLNDKSLSPVEKAAEYARLSRWFSPDGDGTKLLKGSFPPGTFDPNSRHYNADADSLLARNKGTADALQGNPSGLTIFDDPEGNKSFKGGSDSTFAAKIGQDAKGVNDATRAVYAGKEVLVRTDGQGNIGDNPTGYSTYAADDPRLKAANMIPTPGSTRDVNGLPVYQKAQPLTAHAYKSFDSDTGQGIGEVTNFQDSPDVGLVTTMRGDDGIDVPLFGIMVGGQYKWMATVPTTGGATVGQNADGSWELKGFAGATATPAPRTAPGAIMAQPQRPAGAPAEPTYVASTGGMIDRPTIGDPNANVSWDTPLQAGLFHGGAVSHQITKMSDDTVRANSSLYLKDHMTPDMVRQIRLGADPDAVIAAAAEHSVTSVQGARQWGVDPDERSRNMSAMAAQANALTAQNVARRSAMPGDQEGRAALVADVTRWRDQFDGDPQNALGTSAGAPGYYGRAGAFGPPGQRGPQNRTPPLPVGYGETDIAGMLDNPSITTSMAASIAAYLTNGKVGGTLPGQTPTANGLPAGMPGHLASDPRYYGPPTPTETPPTMHTTPTPTAQPKPKPVDTAKTPNVKVPRVQVTNSQGDIGYREGGYYHGRTNI